MPRRNRSKPGHLRPSGGRAKRRQSGKSRPVSLAELVTEVEPLDVDETAEGEAWVPLRTAPGPVGAGARAPYGIESQPDRSGLCSEGPFRGFDELVRDRFERDVPSSEDAA